MAADILTRRRFAAPARSQAPEEWKDDGRPHAGGDDQRGWPEQVHDGILDSDGRVTMDDLDRFESREKQAANNTHRPPPREWQ